MMTKMKNLTSVLFVGLLAFTLASCEDVLGIRGKGDPVTEIRNVKNFHAVDIGTNGELELRIAPDYYVEVTCEESIIAYLVTVEDNGVLKIHFDRDVYDVDHLKIVVSAPSWDGIEVSGSVDVDVPDALTGDVLDLRISGSGDVKVFQADFNKIKSVISGSGNISIDGSADDLTCTISGSGNFDGLGCPVATAKITISGSGNAKVDVSQTLDVTISGSGNVDYRGNAQVTSYVSGSGSVHKI